MEVYKITNLTLSREAEGYNVYDYFDGNPDEQCFATKDDAEKWAEDNYLGDDEDGVGVTWKITSEDIDITEWSCDDGNAEVIIRADSAEEAAQEYVDGGDWGSSAETVWVDVGVTPMIDGEIIIGADDEWVKITIEPDEPDCEDGHEHDWCNPYEVLGGLRENPGVQGHGGGVIITEVCSICGMYRITDTWAQDRSTGEQGLRSVEYRDADEESFPWCLMGIREKISDLSIEAMDISHGIYEDAERICEEINDGDHTRAEAAELLEELTERLEEAKDSDE